MHEVGGSGSADIVTLLDASLVVEGAPSGKTPLGDARQALLESSSTSPGTGMCTSERNVRCTGHICAISNSLARCAPVSEPENCKVQSTRSRRPAFVSHSAQSAA